jgi:hypothetical protein
MARSKKKVRLGWGLTGWGDQKSANSLPLDPIFTTARLESLYFWLLMLGSQMIQSVMNLRLKRLHRLERK